MSATQLIELGSIERGASRLETLQRLLACYALITLILLVRGIPDLLSPDQAATFRKSLDADLFKALLATGVNPETYLRAVWLGNAVALVLLVAAAMSFNRWLLGAFALIATATFGFALGWSLYILGVTIDGAISGEPARIYTLTIKDYARTLALRALMVAASGAVTLNAILVVVILVRRSQGEVVLMRTSGAGRWLSLRRLFAVFDIPQMLTLPARGRLLRVAGVLVGLSVASVGVVIWLMAPVIVALLDGVNLHNCYDDHPDRVLACAAYGYESDITGPFLGYVVIPAAAALIGALIINVVKRFTPAQPLRKGDAPIVFLRSFADDQARIKSRGVGPLTFLLDVGRSPDGIDQLLVYEFANRAPVVALGRPGEKRPPFGAHRIYADHANWRNDLVTLLERAQAVVLVVDRSEGVRWEIEQCMARPDLLAKTLFLMLVPGDFNAVVRPLAKDTLAARAAAEPTMVLGAFHNGRGWTLLAAKRPARITYQIATRYFFAAKWPPAANPRAGSRH